MFLTLVRLYPNSADRESVRRFLLGVLGPTRVQPGCIGCTLASESEPEALLYMETWESMGDLLRRLQSAEFGKVLEAMESSASEPEFSVFELTNQRGLELIERVRKVERRSGKSIEEKLAIVLEGLKESTNIAELCRRHGISQATYYNWRDQLELFRYLA